ncbi:MAG: BatD family protein [Acidobacteriota bacterium]
MSGRGAAPAARRLLPGLLGVLILLLLPGASSFGAGGLHVTGSVSRTRVRLGENVTFTLRVEGGGPLLAQPVLPALSGFQVMGTYQTVETGASGRALLFHYMLSPRNAGRLSVPDLNLRIGSETVTVPGFAVEVETGGAVPSPAKPPPSPSRSPSAAVLEDVLLFGSVSSARVYVGQPVVYTLHLLTRRSVRGLDITRPATFDGFQKVEDPLASKARAVQTRRNGHLYLDAVVMRATLFPLEPGPKVVEDFEAELRLDSAPGRAALRGGGVRLEVAPLPAPPAGFRGSVGRFALRAVEAPPRQVEGGRPVTLALQVEGEGFLPEAPLDVEASPFLQAYPPTAEDSSAFERGILKTRRTYRLAFLPRAAGAVDLPRAKLVAFDPGNRSYSVLEAGGGRVLVGVSSGAAGTQVSLAPLIRRPAPGPAKRALLTRRAFWRLLPAPFVLAALFAAGLGIYRAFFTAPEKRRARALRHRLRRSLHRARRRLDVRRAEEFHEELSRALVAAIDLRTGRSAAGLSRAQLEEVLAQAEPDGVRREKALALADLLERARYAPERPTKMDLLDRYEAVRAWVQGEVEGQRRDRTRGGAAGAGLALVLGVGLLLDPAASAQGPGDLLALQAAQAYDRGDFSEAGRLFLLLKDAEGDGAGLRYNLGNCAFKSGDLGRAILQYRRALRLDPTLEAARHNLEAARRLLPARVPPYEPSPWEAALAAVPPGLLEALVLVFALLGNGALVAALVLSPGPIRRVCVQGVVAAFVLMGAAGAILAYADAVLPRQQPVVVVAPAEVSANPEGGGMPLAVLPPGSEILRVAQAGDRSLVLWGEGRGWTNSSSVEAP